MDNSAANKTLFSFMEEGDNFAEEFIRRYLAACFASLPKSEIHLLVLQLLYGPWKSHRDKNKNQQDMAHESIFELAQKLKISPRRLRLKLDVLAFRQPPENPREKLREILKNGEKQNDEHKVRIQVSDGYVRAHAQDLVRRNLGIVDTSFNTEIISLSPDQFLLLVDDALCNETGDQKN